MENLSAILVHMLKCLFCRNILLKRQLMTEKKQLCVVEKDMSNIYL